MAKPLDLGGQRCYSLNMKNNKANHLYDLTAAEREAVEKATLKDWAQGFALAVTDPATYVTIGKAFLTGFVRGLDR